MKKNNKGFTLIEILCVITILGILFTIGMVSVSNYLQESRKRIYIDTAKQYIRSVSTMIAQNKIVARDKNKVYSIDYRYIEIDSNVNKQSPFGNWVSAYVFVTIDEHNDYTYYWASVDSAGYRIDITENNELDISDIYLSSNKNINPYYPIGGRDNIAIIDDKGKKTDEEPQVEMDLEQASQCFKWEEDTSKNIKIIDYDISCGTSIDIPSKIDGKPVKTIGRNAFRNKGVTSINLYHGVDTIETSAFQNNKLVHVKLSKTIRTVGGYAFYQNQISDLIMSEGITTIGEWAFAGNKICKVSFPKSITKIGSYAFQGNCLTSLDFSGSVTIDGAAFSGNKIEDSKAFIYKTNADGSKDYSYIVGYAGLNKNNVVIPGKKEGVTLKTIGGNAFASAGLTGSITIPEGVVTLGGDSFAWNSLTKVIWPATTLKTINSGAFRSNKLTELNIPDSVTTLGSYAFNQNSIQGAAGLLYARTSTGVDYSIIVGHCGRGGTVVIPAQKNGVTLKLIKANAFESQGLTSITLPSLSETPNLTLEANAFIRNNVSGQAGFFYRTSNGKVDYSILDSYAGPTGGTITIPESYNGVNLTTINASFSWMSYSKIVVPKYVTSISGSAFVKNARCNTKLNTIVNLTGREFDWKTITGSSIAQSKFVTGTVSHYDGNVVVTDKV